jgi:hypothetical protein
MNSSLTANPMTISPANADMKYTSPLSKEREIERVLSLPSLLSHNCKAALPTFTSIHSNYEYYSPEKRRSHISKNHSIHQFNVIEMLWNLHSSHYAIGEKQSC